jgi:hypothetical protein
MAQKAGFTSMMRAAVSVMTMPSRAFSNTEASSWRCSFSCERMRRASPAASAMRLNAATVASKSGLPCCGTRAASSPAASAVAAPSSACSGLSPERSTRRTAAKVIPATSSSTARCPVSPRHTRLAASWPVSATSTVP